MIFMEQQECDDRLSDVSLHFEIARKIPALFINLLIMSAYYFFIY